MLNKHEASFILFAFYQAYNLEKNFFLLAVFSLGRHLRRMSLRRMLLLGTCRHENKAYYTPDEYVETNELIMNCECARPKSTIKRPRVVLFFPFFFSVTHESYICCTSETQYCSFKVNTDNILLMQRVNEYMG